MFHVNLHEDYIAASSVLALPHLLSKWILKLSLYLGCAKSQNLARLGEIAKINTRKIIGTPKSQNFVLANNSNIKVYVRVWAGEWCGESLFGQFSFLSEKIDQEQRALMTKWDLKLVTWPLLAIGVHVQVHVFSTTRGHVTSLRFHFVIRARRSWSNFSLRKENWPVELQRMFEHSNIIRLRFSRTNVRWHPLVYFLVHTLRSELRPRPRAWEPCTMLYARIALPINYRLEILPWRLSM